MRRNGNASVRVAAALSALCLAAPAAAVETVIPASLGHWLEVVGSSRVRLFTTDDGFVCRESNPTVAAPLSVQDFRTWHTPVILHAQPSSVTVRQTTMNAANVATRALSFSESGAIHSSSGPETGSSLVGTLALAPRGTALVQSRLRTLNGTSGCVDNYKITW